MTDLQFCEHIRLRASSTDAQRVDLLGLLLEATDRLAKAAEDRDEARAENKRLRRIVGSVVRNCQHVDDTTPRDEPGPLTGPTWNKVAYLCGLGSTSATALCNEFGVDPHVEPSDD